MNKMDNSSESNRSIPSETGKKDKKKYSLTQDKKYFDSLKDAKIAQRKNVNNVRYLEIMEDSSDYSAMFMTF